MKKNESGMFVFKEGFFVKNFWGRNMCDMVGCFLLGGGRDISYPKNLCILFWGTVFAPFAWILALFVLSPIIVLLGFLCYLFAFFFGFMPVLCKKEYHLRKAKKMNPILCHDYKRYGEKDEKKILFVPWEICSLLVIIWVIFKNNFSFPRGTAVTVFALVTSYIVWIVIGVIALIVGLILFFRSTPGKVTREYLKAKKQKMCPLVIFEKKQKT